MKKENKSRLLFIISMAIFGTIGLFVKNIPLPSAEIALYRAIFATILIGLFLLISRQRIELGKIKKELPLLILSGVAMGFNWILLFEAYKYTTVSAATLSYYFAPVIVTIACPILFREKMTPKQIICFAASTLGIVLITGIGDMSLGNNHFLGILFGLGAAVFYAMVVLINKLIKNTEPVGRTLLQFVAAIIILLPYVLLTDGVHITELRVGGWINLLIVGLIHTGLAYCMYFSAVGNLEGQSVAVLGYIDPLVAVLVSVTLLGERMSVWQAIGGLMILGFTLMNEIRIKRRGHDEEGI